MRKALAQYEEFKASHPEYVILAQTGDRYFTFDDDAKTLAESMGIVLHRVEGRRVASIHKNRLDEAVTKLVRTGHKVALLEKFY